MNSAVHLSVALIESTFQSNPAYRKLGEDMFAVRQGSTFVVIQAIPRGEEGAIIRCVALLVQGIRMTDNLAIRLLRLNARFPLGAFAYEPEKKVVLFLHSILGGETLDAEELLTTVGDVAVIADTYDDGLADHYGGHRMEDLLGDEDIKSALSLLPGGPLLGLGRPRR